MTLKNVFLGLALLLGSGFVNFFITVLVFNPLHNNDITEIGAKYNEDTQQKALQQLQKLSEERLELQQEHLQLLKHHRKLQQKAIQGEISKFREDILSVRQEMGKTRKELEKAQEQFAAASMGQPTEEMECEDCDDCTLYSQQTKDLQKAMEVYFGYRDGINGEMTEAVKDLTRKVAQIPRVNGNELSYKEFYLDYVKSQSPVVITNYNHKMFSQNWTLDFISSYCGEAMVNLHHFDPNREAWGNLYQDQNEVKVSEFIKTVKAGTAGNRYLFDWSIPHNCPRMLDDTYTVPKYFATDFFQRVSDALWGKKASYKHTWPSLFIGTGSTASGLHVDAVQSHFWMAMISGHKRWAVVTPDHEPFLYPHPEKATYLIGDIFDVNLQKYPLVAQATIWETVLEPGDIIFVPGGSAHQIRNMDTIVSISMNFLDGENLERSLPLLFDRYPRVADYMETDEFERKVPSKQRDLPWKQFKTWPRNYEIYDLE